MKPFLHISLSFLSLSTFALAADKEPPKKTNTKPFQATSSENVMIYKEEGRYGGWPANYGLWQWGDEIVAGFRSTWYKEVTNDHRIDRTKPSYTYLARSLDGGRTWKTEKEQPFTDLKKEARPTSLTRALDFTAPDFALMFCFGSLHRGPSWFYTTHDRCKTWEGPYSFTVPGVENICTRTDLIVLGPQDCLMFGSCAKKSDGREGRVFCARTTDGGLTWKLVSFIGEELTAANSFAIMPSSVRLPDGSLLTILRCMNREEKPGYTGYLEAWRSTDMGASWTCTGRPATRTGGNPPATVLLSDGRVAVTYGNRQRPFGMRAVLSSDGGRTWSPEVMIREDGFDSDLGYPRSLARADGSVLTVYYYNGPKGSDRAIEGTIWKAPEVK